MRNDTIKKPEKLGLSALLAIIIGLVITIVAGILLAQLYFSYAGTISKRPAANIEYVDLVVPSTGGQGILTINIKNMGNVKITGVSINETAVGDSLSVDPGETVGIQHMVTDTILPGDVVNAYVEITFEDGSTQVYAISVRARSA